MSNRVSLPILAALVLGVTSAHAQKAGKSSEPCGSVYATSYGPYDYRIYKDRIEIKRVDDAHFTPMVEALIKPMFGKAFAPDFDYTLHTTPNHHRALASMTRNSLKLRNAHPDGARWSVDCYFVRGMTFAPDDYVVRMLYADYLIKVGGRTADAIRHLDLVAANAGENAFTVYNSGLLYFDAKEFDKARTQAQLAANLGLTWPALREKLRAAGQWAAGPETSAPAAPPNPSSVNAPASAPGS